VQTQVDEAPDAKQLVLSTGGVEYRAVNFSYEPGNPILQRVSFTARGGTTVAFVGATGSGKSTITRLLLRFYDPSSGAVLVDGQDVRGLCLASLRAAVGVVPQVRRRRPPGGPSPAPARACLCGELACVAFIAGRWAQSALSAWRAPSDCRRASPRALAATLACCCWSSGPAPGARVCVHVSNAQPRPARPCPCARAGHSAV
jgi:hypothetical protein